MLFPISVLETQISYFLADGKWRAASEKIKLRIFCVMTMILRNNVGISPFLLIFILVFDSFFLDVAIVLDPLLLEIFVVIDLPVFTLAAALLVTLVAALWVTLLAALAAAWRALQAKVEDEEERETEKPEGGWF